MKTIEVFVVVPPRVLLLDLAGPLDVLRKAALLQDDWHFTITYVGPEPEIRSSIGVLLAAIAPLPPSLPDDAWVILPGDTTEPLSGEGEGERSATPDSGAAQDRIVQWLAEQVRPSHRLVAICSGALLAAKARLLDGHECTTHHDDIAELAKIAPNARVIDNRLFVQSGNRLTSAGITSGIDLMLHLVAEVAGHHVAMRVARHLVVYLRREGRDPQLSPWLEGRNHIHPAIHRAQDAVSTNPAKPWSVLELARIAGASPRNLSRLFNAQTGMSVGDYINRMRIALAHDLVTRTDCDMEDIAARVGYASSRQLRRAWSRFHPHPPRHARLDAGET